MKFVDEATIRVQAGKGGDGSSSFRREKYVPFGGPDGGDGGRGGSVILEGDSGLNTLVDFRHKRLFRAQKGEPGRGRQMAGRSGEDLVVRVPLGTVITDVEANLPLGEVTRHGQRLVIARGGRGGLGNVHFKSSTNRAPRKTVPGAPGEERELQLELKVLADVGLLGFPNAGKSSLISAVSAARPKVADYPFTTLHPNLGVVSVGVDQNFVIADIPGIIEGAAEGAGLGIQFLKHLARTRILLHLVDLAPMDGKDPAESVRELESELEQYDEALADKPRWLVFSKADLLPEGEAEALALDVMRELDFDGEWAVISSVTGHGTEALMKRIMTALDRMREAEAEQARNVEEAVDDTPEAP